VIYKHRAYITDVDRDTMLIRYHQYFDPSLRSVSPGEYSHYAHPSNMVS
jgi:hypothetical protein